MRKIITRFFELLILWSCAVSSLWATTYTVKPGGGGNFTTIQACANAAVAGDTCLVDPGTYNETVTPANSGSSGSPITFQAATSTRPKVRAFNLSRRSYITVTGFEITHSGMTQTFQVSVIVTGSDHVRIVDNYIHDTIFIAIRANSSASDTKSTNLYIGGNTITNVGPANSGPPYYTGGRSGAISVWGDNALIENNNISRCGDFNRVVGGRNVIRNNLWHDAYEQEAQGYNGTPGSGEHLDGWQGFALDAVGGSVYYLLIEGNYQYNVPGPNGHFALINDTDGVSPGPTTIIVRHNTAYNVGSGFYGADTNQQPSTDNHKIYNNTTVKTPRLDGGSNGVINLNGVVTGTVLNNIFCDSGDDYNPRGYILKSGDGTSGGDYNLGFFTSGSRTWSAPINAEPHHVLNQDPLFVNSAGNFSLQSGSPARGAGGPLTAVAAGDTGSGTSLLVRDAHFFQDGWAGVRPDCISVGTAGNQVCITKVNYQTNTLTLARSIGRSAGDSVWLYSDSTGRTVLIGSAPNIGAPFASAPPPTSLTAR